MLFSKLNKVEGTLRQMLEGKLVRDHLALYYCMGKNANLAQMASIAEVGIFFLLR